jgi:T5orf172 domain
MTGYVYILTNPVYPGLVKVGKTCRDVRERRDELYTTGVPLPFDIYATFKTTKYNELEEYLHRNLTGRINENREFFKIDPEEIMDLVCDLAPLLPDFEVETYNVDPVDFDNLFINAKPAGL